MYVVLLGPSAAGKTTMQALMCQPQWAGLPKGIRIQAADPRDAEELQRLASQFEQQLREMPRWVPVDVTKLVPATPNTGDVLVREFSVGWKDRRDDRSAKELFRMGFVDFAGGLLTEQPAQIIEKVVEKTDGTPTLLVPVLDAVRLMEVPFMDRDSEIGLATEKVAEVLAGLIEADENFFCSGVCVTRCETYASEWATSGDRRRFFNALHGWCSHLLRLVRNERKQNDNGYSVDSEMSGVATPDEKETIKAFRLYPDGKTFGNARVQKGLAGLQPFLCYTTGCLRVREVRRRDGETSAWDFTFERTDAEFEPRHVGAVAASALLRAAWLADRNRGVWRRLVDFVKRHSDLWDRMKQELEDCCREAGEEADRAIGELQAHKAAIGS
ncbi:MAG: hypothetical protein D6725_04345 [Planctomycetota bacterium]|nr:MAG: hypothetical protein D6725_04345 [Planctomycetota bacterium]